MSFLRHFIKIYSLSISASFLRLHQKIKIKKNKTMCILFPHFLFHLSLAASNCSFNISRHAVCLLPRNGGKERHGDIAQFSRASFTSQESGFQFPTGFFDRTPFRSSTLQNNDDPSLCESGRGVLVHIWSVPIAGFLSLFCLWFCCN